MTAVKVKVLIVDQASCSCKNILYDKYLEQDEDREVPVSESFISETIHLSATTGISL